MRNFFLRLVVFFAILPLPYLLILFFLSRIDVQGAPLAAKVLKNGAVAGGDNYDLMRFREVDEFEDIDVLFLGSSHAFRSFDPRIFQAEGIKSFVLGSGAQSPLNSYYLLKQYAPKLKPKLIVFELYFKVFETPSGLESFYDLVLNMPLSKELLEMAFATHSFEALNSMGSEFFIRQRYPFSARSQKKNPNYSYVRGGYVETQSKISNEIKLKVYGGVLAPRQLEYLKKIIRYAQRRHIPIVLVTQPLPREYRAVVIHYQEMARQFRSIAASFGVDYFDFNDMTQLETHQDFCDAHHLNASGVKKFNEDLLKILSLSRFKGFSR